jgi:hypothetical protein
MEGFNLVGPRWIPTPRHLFQADVRSAVAQINTRVQLRSGLALSLFRAGSISVASAAQVEGMALPRFLLSLTNQAQERHSSRSLRKDNGSGSGRIKKTPLLAIRLGHGNSRV